MTSQQKTLILTTYLLETRMYVETDVFWNVKPCRLMDRFLWNCGRCHTGEEHNSNTEWCGSLESHKHMILSDISNVHNPYFDKLTERRWHNSDEGLGQTRNYDCTTVVHRKLQENIPPNISSRPRSELRNYDAGTTLTCSMHWWTLSKRKSKTQTQKETLGTRSSAIYFPHPQNATCYLLLLWVL